MPETNLPGAQSQSVLSMADLLASDSQAKAIEPVVAEVTAGVDPTIGSGPVPAPLQPLGAGSTDTIESLGLGGEEGHTDTDHLQLQNQEQLETRPTLQEAEATAIAAEATAIAADTSEKFKVGDIYESADALLGVAKTFCKSRYFTVRKATKNTILCSRASNWNSKQKEAGKLVPKKQESALACDCKWMIKFSNKKEILPKVTISEVYPIHNHPCNIASAVVSYKKSGKSVEEAISQVTQILAPLILSKKPLPCNLVRWTIKPHISPGVVLESKTIGNIMRGVNAQIKSGNFTAPPPIIDLDVMRAFTTVDITSENCSKVLQELVSNSNGDNSWIVSRLMQRLKEADHEYFDYRLHYDNQDHVDCVTWQVGPCRGALERYGQKIFLDTRNNENMNSINMQYMSFIVIDDNHQIMPASESFVFNETINLYGCACTFTLDMTPGLLAEDVEFGWGDLKLSPEHVKQWFPNITWQVDTYHFCSPSNKQSVLAIDFGPKWWARIQTSMRAAVYSKTENECLVSAYILLSMAYTNSFIITHFIYFSTLAMLKE